MGIVAGIFGIVALFICMPLIKAILAALNQEAPRMVYNIGGGLANATDSLPTMGATFTAETISDSLSEVNGLKASLGCDDPAVITMIQLNNWMKQNNMY